MIVYNMYHLILFNEFIAHTISCITISYRIRLKGTSCNTIRQWDFISDRISIYPQLESSMKKLRRLHTVDNSRISRFRYFLKHSQSTVSWAFYSVCLRRIINSQNIF